MVTNSTNLRNEAHQLVIKNFNKMKLFSAPMGFIERADTDNPIILVEYN